MSAVAEAVAAGVLPERVWLYSNYHCNLACSYCLTESAPGVPKRQLTTETMLRTAEEAADLGFRAIGVTGGEPFLSPAMPETLARLAQILPLVALSNGTLFSTARLDRLRPLAELPAKIQISLDSPDPDVNDAARGPENFNKVVEAVPRLVERGIAVRIATTVEVVDEEAMSRLCALHRELGVPDDDHVVRPIVRRGRAVDNGLGVAPTPDDLSPELTVTADGAFWSPFGPTVHAGVLDTDLLLTRTTSPLSRPAHVLLGLVEGRPPSEGDRLKVP